MLNLFGKKTANRQKVEFAELYAEYYPVVLSTIFSRVGSIEVAEELTHDVFSKYIARMKSQRQEPAEIERFLAKINFDEFWVMSTEY
ncbi:MAG: hypothetical protein GY754_42615 [bacterium]|nr:hypothetical protein [bacterium]